METPNIKPMGLDSGLTMTNTQDCMKLKSSKEKSGGGNLPMASVIIGLKIVLYRRFPMGYQNLSGMIKGAGIVKPHFCYKKLT